MKISFLRSKKEIKPCFLFNSFVKYKSYSKIKVSQFGSSFRLHIVIDEKKFEQNEGSIEILWVCV